MPATATAPARSPRPRGRHSTSRFVPVAVGRTAVAVGGLADSGLMVRLTRGRLWIGLLATLLVGIVGLNVVALSFSARSSQAGGKAEALEQRNSALRAQLASQLSTHEIQAAASKLGLVTPPPDAIRYVKAGGGDAEVAAKRLRSGELTSVDSVAPPPVAEATAPVTPVEAAAPPADPAAATATDTAATATTDPAAAAVTDPAAAAPVETTAPATTQPGGVAAP